MVFRRFFVGLIIMAISHGSVCYGNLVTDWMSFNSNAALGNLNGVTVTGTRNAGGPFIGIINSGGFSSPGAWNAPMPLPQSAEGIFMGPVNAGADHVFSFSSPLSQVLFYVENFDSFSDAVLTAQGATSLAMVAASQNMFFNPISPSSGRLFTNYGGFNGQADAVVQISGSVQSLRLQYTNGIQNNGIVYTFAVVPEPGSLALVSVCSMFFIRPRSEANRKSFIFQ